MTESDGKIAVITGAGSGMARACSRVFVRKGARVLGADISGRELETAAELGDAVAAAMRQRRSEHGRPWGRASHPLPH